MLLLGIKLNRQQRESDCLIACCEMILDYLQVPNTYDQLAMVLDAQEFGAYFGNVQNLTAWGLTVIFGKNTRLHIFERYLSLGLPVLIAVNTWTLPHWKKEETQHALIVVGLDIATETIYVLDPFFDQAPIELTFDQFEPAWTEMERQFAVIALEEIDA